MEPSAPVSGPVAPPDEAPRVISIDALRGFDMFWILGAGGLVSALDKISNSDSSPSPVTTFLATQLKHVDWAGFHFEDFIFPLFVFIVGVSIVFSLNKTVARQGKAAAHWRVIRRSAILYALGILYSGGFSHEWPEIRLLGVLNRIALCYLFTSLLFLHLKTRGLAVACVVLLIGYWGLMTFVPVPEIGAGSFEKGANLANYIDQQYLAGRKYEGTWDPEGLLSTLPAIGTCLLGVLAGLLLRAPALPAQKKTGWLILGGAVLVGLGFAWGLQFPVIKKIWTSSYVLIAGGYSAILLGLFYQVIDVWGYRRWAMPFVWIGSNAITLYLLGRVLNFGQVASFFAGGDIKLFFDSSIAVGTGDLVVSIVMVLLVFLVARFFIVTEFFCGCKFGRIRVLVK